MDHDDFIIDAIYEDSPKKIKSKPKGKRGELEVVDLFNKRFSSILKDHPEWGTFSRSVGSGNRWSQNVRLSNAAKNVYAGDLTCPDNFRFVIESKNGYDEIELCHCFKGQCKKLDAFLEHVTNDAKRVNRIPLLVWKKTRMNRISFIPCDLCSEESFSTIMYYKKWMAVSFEDLLKINDDFWFNAGQVS